MAHEPTHEMTVLAEKSRKENLVHESNRRFRMEAASKPTFSPEVQATRKNLQDYLNYENERAKRRS